MKKYRLLPDTDTNDIAHTCVIAGHSPDKVRWDCVSAGSSDASEMKATVTSILEKLIREKGVNTFLCGMTRGMSLLMAGYVIKLKKKYPDIRLKCYVPDQGFLQSWPEDQKALFLRTTEKSSAAYYLSDDPNRYIYRTRREYMIDNAAYLLAAYIPGREGGTGEMVRYAYEHGRIVIIVDPETRKEYGHIAYIDHFSTGYICRQLINAVDPFDYEYDSKDLCFIVRVC